MNVLVASFMFIGLTRRFLPSLEKSSFDNVVYNTSLLVKIYELRHFEKVKYMFKKFKRSFKITIFDSHDFKSG